MGKSIHFWLILGLLSTVSTASIDDLTDAQKKLHEIQRLQRAFAMIIYHEGQSKVDYRVTYQTEDCFATPIFFHWTMAMTSCACSFAIDKVPLEIHWNEEYKQNHSFLIPVDKNFFLVQIKRYIPGNRKYSEIVLTIRHPRCQWYNKKYFNNIAVIKTAKSLRNQDPRMYLNYPALNEDLWMIMRNMVVAEEEKCWSYSIDFDFKMYKCNLFGEKHGDGTVPYATLSLEIERGFDKLCISTSCHFSQGLPICCGPGHWPRKCFGIAIETCDNGAGILVALFGEYAKFYMGLRHVVELWNDAMIIYDSTDKRSRVVNFYKMAEDKMEDEDFRRSSSSRLRWGIGVCLFEIAILTIVQL